ncbi:dihydrolipoamide acetyltransferase family protein [Thermophagus sp. OGC60D27]|uniref:dihydrolipoamide acetyltransferase family protein n=1 Tax=Thermophagus sp. OGC60D27 TaxID=3458415 RepID=UPI004037CDCE
MSTFEILMPKMGESVEEATITKWFVKVGDKVEEDDPLLEIATDKVDSEIPSPVAGTVKEIKFNVDDVVPVGTVVAIVALEGEESDDVAEEKPKEIPTDKEAPAPKNDTPKVVKDETKDAPQSDRFYSPLVKSIAKEEGISFEELDAIPGSGKDGRVTKDDIMNYLSSKKSGEPTAKEAPSAALAKPSPNVQAPKVSASAEDEIVEMDRMRKLIADHMVMSKQVSPHVTSVVEADVTNLVIWRNKVKNQFQEKYGEKLTFMPLFAEAVAKALRDFPGVNVSVDGYNIIKRRNVNIGIAVALPSGNLIVPVVKQADQKNIVGLASDINRLADAARNNKLTSDDIQGGTFTITNFGSFKNTIGTPIINQPQVAILATGTIEKKPAVIETPEGDAIAIRHKMFLSLSYDHRVVDGALGGMFLRRIADYLEKADINRGV